MEDTSRLIAKKDVVDTFFRNGIPHLLGFNPWTIERVVKGFEKTFVYQLFVNDDFLNICRIYADNWNRVIGKWFEWRPVEFEDPVDQCKWTADSFETIVAELFEGIDLKENKNEPQFVNLYYMTLMCIERLCEEIFPWCLTHKFMEPAHNEE